MKKSVKVFSLLVLSTLLLCCSVIVLFSFSNKTVKADTSDKNGIFSVDSTQMGIHLVPVQNEYTVNTSLRFNFSLDNVNYDDIYARTNDYYWTNAFGMKFLKDDIFYENVITLKRANSDGSKTALAQLAVNYTIIEVEDGILFQRTVWTKKLNYCDEIFDENCWNVNEEAILADNYTILENAKALHDKYKNAGYTFVSGQIISEDGWLFYDFTDSSEKPCWMIDIFNISDYTQYCVEYSYNFNEYDHTNGIYDYYKTTSGSVESTAVSIYSKICEQKESGEFENNLDIVITHLQSIYDKGNTQKVNIEYLVPIEGTPFATKKSETVEVPVINNTLELDDVYGYLNVKTLDIYDAHVKSFTYRNGVYVADYYKSFWLKATTVEGNQVNYFNDFNKSYQEYYYSYVENGVFDNGVYEFMFNSMLEKYPALLPYQTAPDKVYGLWGMAVLPETYSIDSIWKDLFSTETTKGEQVSMFSFKRQLSISEYNALLTTYEYNWLEKVWNNLGGFVEGMYSINYLFYAEPGTEISWIDLTGQTQDKEDVKEPDNPGIVGGTINDVTTDVGDVFSGIYDVTIGRLAKANGWVSIAVIVAVVAVGVLIYSKLKGKKKRR